ncbi:auxin-induced protein 22A-like [Cucurbita pepo subsp. pepo]|uniref:auxin-induced protein 22A-like n=1 Tax=Cucurbita pepo subsp. pepo TaxID=3664 RepID=UPI000C9D2937|nr:auxin-induced protein 22A-like [Cucurbita pepo subsp. pepo]
MASNGLELEITELRLGLPGSGHTSTSKHDNKRVFSEMNANEGGDERSSTDCDGADRRRSKKNQVVGWPPVCSYRRRSNGNDKDLSETSKMYVKVSMDGAPYLRKVDLGMHKGYSDLGMAMENLFGCAIGSSDYVPIYEDRDGDWMLVGDVPWKMFVESCKRLRIMKRSEAKGFEIQVPKTRSSSSPRKL